MTNQNQSCSNAFKNTYPSVDAARADLEAHGFTPGKSEGVWAKPSKVDDWYGGYATTALVTIERRCVDPIWNAPDYYELRFL